MARLSDDHDEGISLFPMFNILACTLGVMVFILATVATVSLGADKAVEIVANIDPGEEEPRTPIWIEWDGRELALVDTDVSVPFERPLHDFDSWEATYDYMSATLAGTPLGSTIGRAGLNNESQYAVLLVRPSGFASALEVRSYLDFLGMEVGYEPINQSWQRVGIK